jgi:hypothetical protein
VVEKSNFSTFVPESKGIAMTKPDYVIQRILDLVYGDNLETFREMG